MPEIFVLLDYKHEKMNYTELTVQNSLNSDQLRHSKTNQWYGKSFCLVYIVLVIFLPKKNIILLLKLIKLDDFGKLEVE